MASLKNRLHKYHKTSAANFSSKVIKLALSVPLNAVFQESQSFYYTEDVPDGTVVN